MASTTITEFTAMPCTRCSGAGRISSFQYKNGGECFRCGATGIDPVMKAIDRDMTDEEVTASLKTFGFDIVSFEEEPEGLYGLFLSDAQAERLAATNIGARMMLSAI